MSVPDDINIHSLVILCIKVNFRSIYSGNIKLEAFTDDILDLAEMMISVFDKAENIVGKGENAGYQHFLLFPQCFQMSSLSRILKVVNVWYRLKPFCVKWRFDASTNIFDPSQPAQKIPAGFIGRLKLYPVVRDRTFIHLFILKARAISADSYVQSDLVLHSPLFYLSNVHPAFGHDAFILLIMFMTSPHSSVG